MACLIWSPEAIADIDGIADYIARDSEFYAAVVAQRLFDAPTKLLDFQRLGRVVPESNVETIREIFIHDYRLMYEISRDAIHVLAVVHGRRRFSAELIEPSAPANAGSRLRP